jgi:hypothetical protein
MADALKMKISSNLPIDSAKMILKASMVTMKTRNGLAAT